MQRGNNPLNLFTLYSKNYAMSCSSASIFDAGVNAAIFFLDVLDNQCTSANVQAIWESAIDQEASRDDEMASIVRWCLV